MYTLHDTLKPIKGIFNRVCPYIIVCGHYNQQYLTKILKIRALFGDLETI